MNSLFRTSFTRLSSGLTARAMMASKPNTMIIPQQLTRQFSITSRLLTEQQQTQQTPQPQQKILPDLTPLKLEGDLYAVLKIHNNPFLVTKGDKIILPYNLKTAEAGDVLRFTHVSTIGSRNYTYVGENDRVDEELFEIKAVVLEKTKLPMRIREITKRRQRKVRHAISKPHRTILRVTELKLK
ncbi:hypothetical protein WICPIJ_004305 [Wickerhamomyces pijperi]|uniref:Large ribosomal subunit protein bL21m n=1 Tax=Wickerhamomyces pijperi TaxID=599730 RepID=A0A9P8Q8C5_WICPI|nr:hypothetical protein WICPIJ_004305 [Wickerhamomyces pijperi]